MSEQEEAQIAARAAAHRTIAECQRELRRLRALINSDDADVRALAHGQWDDVSARYRAALGVLEEAADA